MPTLHPKIILFDTETNGLPRSWRIPFTSPDNWPRMVQLAWMVFDSGERLIKERSLIIRPDGWVVNDEAAAIHRITHARALAEGVRVQDALAEFADDWDEARIAVAHNFDFDKNIVGAEWVREKGAVVRSIPAFMDGVELFCTMQNGTDLCKLPGRYGYKWPTLTELHTHLFGLGFAEAHDALVDVQACARSFFAMVKARGHMGPKMEATQ